MMAKLRTFKIMQVSKEQFESWVAEAIDNVPEKFQEKINNLTFFVEDYPTGEQLKKVKLLGRRDVSLLGLYEGYHQAKRLNSGPVFPDRITVFKKPMENFCATEAELRKQVFETVRHEIAHHFGSDEPGARKAGRGKK
jgi:predicted Zn-dependent protease with MMP-like domain